MGTVIDWKTRKPVVTTPPAQQAGATFECTRCNAKAGLFKLLATGEVRCGDCDVRIANLKVDTIGEVKNAS